MLRVPSVRTRRIERSRRSDCVRGVEQAVVLQPAAEGAAPVASTAARARGRVSNRSLISRSTGPA